MIISVLCSQEWKHGLLLHILLCILPHIANLPQSVCKYLKQVVPSHKALFLHILWWPHSFNEKYPRSLSMHLLIKFLTHFFPFLTLLSYAPLILAHAENNLSVTLLHVSLGPQHVAKMTSDSLFYHSVKVIRLKQDRRPYPSNTLERQCLSTKERCDRYNKNWVHIIKTYTNIFYLPKMESLLETCPDIRAKSHKRLLRTGPMAFPPSVSMNTFTFWQPKHQQMDYIAPCASSKDWLHCKLQSQCNYRHFLFSHCSHPSYKCSCSYFSIAHSSSPASEANESLH